MDKVFGQDGRELRSAFSTHPGVLLLEEIEERKLKKTEFARQIGVLPSNLSEIFNGKRSITPRVAVRLEQSLNISAEYWLNLQSAYDLAKARALEHA